MSAGGPLPPGPGSGGPEHAEDPVAQRVEAALRSALDAEPVDLRELRASTRRGVARARTRRRSAVAGAALLAAAVPFGASFGGGLVTAGGHPDATTSAVAPGLSSPATPGPEAPPSDPADVPAGGGEEMAPAATATPIPSALAPPGTTPATRTSGSATVPAPSATALEGPQAVAYDIPDAVALQPDDFPLPMTLDLDLGQYRKQPTVPGQGCLDEVGPEPVAGRQWMWTQAGSERMDQLQVVLVVTGWAAGSADERFQDLLAGTGRCRFLDPHAVADSSDLPGEQTWAATSRYASLRYGRVAVRFADEIIGIEVAHPDGTGAALALARELVSVTAKRLQEEAPE